MSLNRNNDFQYSVDINHNNQTADLIQRPLDQIHNALLPNSIFLSFTDSFSQG